MLKSAIEAMGYIQGRCREDLDNDSMLVHAIVRCLTIIGEAAARVTTECRKELPDVAWDEMIGMRTIWFMCTSM